MKKDFRFFCKLFTSTFTLSAFTFGGGYVIIPMMRRKFVEQYHWMEEDKVLDMTAIAQPSRASARPPRLKSPARSVRPRDTPSPRPSRRARNATPALARPPSRRKNGSGHAPRSRGDDGRSCSDAGPSPRVAAPSGRAGEGRRRSGLPGELLPHLIDLLLIGLLGGIPALGGHLLIQSALHAQALVQRLVERIVYIAGGGLDGAVHIQVAHALGGQKQVFHDESVVHRGLPPYTSW